VTSLSLEAEFPLNRYQKDFDEINIKELTDNITFSFAIPDSNFLKLNIKLQKLYNVKLPIVGNNIFISNINLYFMGLQPNQFYLFSKIEYLKDFNSFIKIFSEFGYFTDQSDSWLILRISGENCINVLERICPLNLDSETFLNGNVLRTSMEHIGAIIMRMRKNEFILFSPRSSANSFIHSLETSINNVL
tara:strand:- start:1523 stop:2092 length:570 start_codon:yes stop_codon:yes gene_type:complete